MTSVILPPSTQDLGRVRELLELAADPVAMRQALEQLRDATNVHAAELEAARAARRDAEDAERRAQEIMREVERRTARVEGREQAVAEREMAVAAREGKLEVIRRKIA
jgi:seryl-tRNA synthetase